MRRGTRAVRVAAGMLLAVWVAGCSGERGRQELIKYSAPAMLPHTTEQMRSAAFWISRLDAPDTLVLDAAGIETLNARIMFERKLTRQVKHFPAAVPGGEVRGSIREGFRGLSSRTLYDAKARVVRQAYYDALLLVADPGAVKDTVETRYALVSRMADQRIIPTEDVLTEKPFDLEFDEVQNSSLDIGTPLVVLHESRDKKWVWAQAQDSSGWVRKDAVAFCSAQEYASYCTDPFFWVAVSPRVALYLDAKLTRLAGVVRMGTVLPLGRKAVAGAREVLIPYRTPEGDFEPLRVYAASEEGSEGFLPFTPRVVLQQAFKLLDAPYGWGGMHGAQDCSSFLQQVYGSVGVRLPRNSSEQGKAGEALAQLSGALPGDTIVHLNGHIMLYLGEVDGRHYCIHATSGYREKTAGGTRFRALHRVVVSDLSLGEGTPKGSLLQRVKSIRSLGTGSLK